MPFSSIQAVAPFLLVAVTGSSVLALMPDQVASKLDTIIVFAPINPKFPDKVLPLNYKLDGQSRSVYFAAFSPSAVESLINEKIASQNLNLAKTLKFAPFSFAKFDSLVQTSMVKDKNSRVIYIPDPEQVSITEKLLIKQGAKKADAIKVAASMPAIFCPQPAIKATPNKGPLKGQAFVPCSTDYQTVQDMIKKGLATNAALKNSKPEVLAIPMTNFVGLLAKGDKKEVGDIRILPSPSTIKALVKLRSSKLE
jgi:hypothetical protein